MRRLAQSAALSLRRNMSRDAAPASASSPCKVRTHHGASAAALRPRARLLLTRRATPHATQVLFCGLEFHDGFKLTAKELAADPRFDVTACRREDVAAHIADAHIAVRGAPGAHTSLPAASRRAPGADVHGVARVQVPLMSRLDAQLLARAPALRYVLQFGVGLEARRVALHAPSVAR
jgi:hypothetical protein